MLKDLSESFEAYRDGFIKTDSYSHGRVAEMVAWLTIGMKRVLMEQAHLQVVVP